MHRVLSQVEIRGWFASRRALQRLQAVSPSISKIAEMAGMSRQTLYALLRNERSEFGEVAQVRLSRVIQRISADPLYNQSRLLQVRLTPTGVKLGFFN